jgi:hypothetical protein
MSGYAASARLRGGSLTLTLAGGRIGRQLAETADMAEMTEMAEMAEMTEMAGDDAVGGSGVRSTTEPEADGPSSLGRLAAFMDDLHEAWLQTTFYLFDPNSWR